MPAQSCERRPSTAIPQRGHLQDRHGPGNPFFLHLLLSREAPVFWLHLTLTHFAQKRAMAIAACGRALLSSSGKTCSADTPDHEDEGGV